MKKTPIPSNLIYSVIPGLKSLVISHECSCFVRDYDQKPFPFFGVLLTNDRLVYEYLDPVEIINTGVNKTVCSFGSILCGKLLQ